MPSKLKSTSQLRSKKDLETNGRIKYQVATNIFISECGIIWSRYNAMLVFNTLLVSSIGFIYSNNLKLPIILTFLLPIIGLISCYAWYATAYRGFGWIKYWISAANKLEDEYLSESNDLLNPVVRGEDHKRLIAFPSTPTLALGLIPWIALIYIILLCSQILSVINIITATSFYLFTFTSRL